MEKQQKGTSSRTGPPPPVLTEENHAQMLLQYEVDDPSAPRGVFCMFKDHTPDADFCTGNTAGNVAYIELFIRPFVGRPLNEHILDTRLRDCDIKLTSEFTVTAVRGTAYNIRCYHVSWRFYLFIVVRAAIVIGYHYYAVDKKTAVLTNCF